jgi:hypothetical protein
MWNSGNFPCETTSDRNGGGVQPWYFGAAPDSMKTNAGANDIRRQHIEPILLQGIHEAVAPTPSITPLAHL